MDYKNAGVDIEAGYRAVELMKETGSVTGPKQLGTFGASYLYPVFVRIGVIRAANGGSGTSRAELDE